MLKLKIYPSKARVENTFPKSSKALSAKRKMSELIKTPAFAYIAAHMFLMFT